MSKQTLDDAIGTIHAWYYAAIREIVDDAIVACCGTVAHADPEVEKIAADADRLAADADEGGPVRAHWEAEARRIRAEHPIRVGEEREGRDPEEFMQERIDEVTDGHQIVIHTMQAKCALLASDNEDAYQDEIGEPAPNVEAAACMAMRRDCWDLLNSRSDEWKERDCDDCCTTLGPDVVDVVSDEHDESCSLHPSARAGNPDDDATEVQA